MASMLDTINDALGQLAERPLTAAELTAGSGEAARVMAAAWPLAVDVCLMAAPWRFASFLVEIPYRGKDEDGIDPTLYAAPGYSRAYPLPDDHLRTNWIRDYADQSSLPIPFHLQDGYWHTNSGSLFAHYVSHQYREPEHWPVYFAKTVSAYLAWEKGPRIRPATDQSELRLTYEATLDRARTTDGSETPFSWNPPGRLVRSRGGRNLREQGSRW